MNIKKVSHKIPYRICGLVLVMSIFISSLTFGGSFAFFYKTTPQDNLGTIGVDDDGSATIDIENESELILHTKATAYESHKMSTERKVLRLTKDIVLTSNLYISADCHIDLNGRNIFTNGFDIFIEHAFYGVLYIGGGNIVSDLQDLQTKLSINTPNAAVVVEATLSNVELIIDNISDEQLLISIMNKITAQISNSLNFRDGSHLFNLGFYGNPFDNRLVSLPKLDSCVDGCAYITSNIDLPTFIPGYDIDITYTSSNTAVLSNSGRVSPTADVSDVTLNVELSNNNATLSKDYKLHIISDSDHDALSDAALNIFLYDFSKFLVIYDEEEHVYAIGGSILLPKYSPISGGTYSYTALNDSLQPVLNAIKQEDEDNGLIYTNYYILYPSSQTKYLRVEANHNGVTSTSNILPIMGETMEVISNINTIANKIAYDFYSGRIFLQNLHDSVLLKYDLSSYSRYKVNHVTYTLINNVNGTYEFDYQDGVPVSLKVASGKNPEEYLENVYVSMRFAFETDNEGVFEYVTVDVPVMYSPEGGSNVNIFLPYYNYFNSIFQNASSRGYTYTTFEMPANYNGDFPHIYFEVLGDNDGAINITKSPDGSKWIININTNAISKTDNQISIKYRYTFREEPNLENWEGSGAAGTAEYFSHFTLPGIVRNDATGIPDAALYSRVWNIYHLGEQYTQGQTFIIASRLSRGVDELVFTNNSTQTTGKINSFVGLRYLTGVKNLYLNNSGITVAQIRSDVALMTGLTYLTLANNNLTDGSGFNVNNEFISSLSTLINLTELHLENNVIYDFRGLNNLPALTKVYLYNNLPTYTLWVINLSSVIQSIYGSRGSINTAVFSQMASRGIEVYNMDALTPFAPGDGVSSEYDKLTNIIYQKKLPVGMNIAVVWENFSTNPEDYNLSGGTYTGAPPGEVNQANYNARNSYTATAVVEFAAVGSDPTTATAFTVTYKNYVYAQVVYNYLNQYEQVYEYTVTVTYYVERV